jgi:hypothetical protein
MFRYVRLGVVEEQRGASEGRDLLVMSIIKFLMIPFRMWNRHSLFGLLEEVIGPAAALLVGIPFPYPRLRLRIGILGRVPFDVVVPRLLSFPHGMWPS